MVATRSATLEIQLVADVARLQSDMKAAQRAIDGMTGAATTGFNRAGAAASEMARSAQRSAVSAGQMKSAGQQLSFQLGDIAQGFAMGTKASTIFAQQSGQVIQAVSLMAGGTGRLATFLGGPWGIALTAATLVLAPFIGKLFDTASAADTATNALQSLIQKQREQAAEATKATIAEGELNRMRDDRLKLLSQIDAAEAIRVKNREASNGPRASGIERLQARVRALNLQIAEGQAALDIANASTQKAVKAAEHHTAATKSQSAAISDSARALDQAAEAARSYAETLEEQIAKFGKSALEIQRMEVAAKAAAAPTAELAQRIRDAGAALEGLQVKKATEDFDKMITAIYNEIELSGLVGKAREMAALALEKEGKMAEWAALGLTDLNNKWLAYSTARIAGIERKSALDRDAKAADKLAEELGRVNALLDDFIGSLHQVGGLGGVIGGVLGGLQTGNFAGLGAVGGLLNVVLGGAKDYKKIGDVIADRLETVFGISGPFARTMASVLQGAGMGSLGGALIGRNNAGAAIGGALGGAFQSTITKGLSSVFGKAAGKILGDMVPIVGGLIGGLLGSLFKKDRYGSAAISNSGVGISGNNADGKSGASSAGNSVSGAISRIAEQLGGTVGNYAVSIGLTNGKWNVNPGTVTGMIGTTKQRDTIDFKQDQEGAIRWAIANAIQDGAIQGVNHIQQWLLKNTKDIDAALNQATRVGAVFDELKQKTDPLGYALEQIDKQFGDLRDTFTQAGATAEEMAKLEQLIAMKRQDAILEELNKRRELEVRLMEAQGNAAGALALSREIELSQTDANLQSLMRQIYAAEDARTASEQASAAIAEAASKFGDLAKNLRDYASSLTGSDSAGALGYRSAQVEFLKQSSLAAAGDLGGLGSLQNAASSFLDVSRSRSTAAQYQRDFGQVLAALDKAATVAEGLSAPGAAVLTGSGAGTLENVAVTITDGNASLKAEIVQLRSDINAALLAIAQNTSSADRTLKRWDRGDSMAVTADDALPVDTTP